MNTKTFFLGAIPAAFVIAAVVAVMCSAQLIERGHAVWGWSILCFDMLTVLSGCLWAGHTLKRIELRRRGDAGKPEVE